MSKCYTVGTMTRPRFANGEFYHIYNRGVDKRPIFSRQSDIHRFLESIDVFNSINPVGSIFENTFVINKRKSKTQKLVNIICYCLNINHFHLMLEQLADGGISEFMKRVGIGYTKYFNAQERRSGVLFQSKFKAVHVDSNEYLLRLNSYINLNNRINSSLGHRMSKSSWEEYIGIEETSFCAKGIILKQFRSIKEYKEFALDALQNIKEHKRLDKEFEILLLEK